MSVVSSEKMVSKKLFISATTSKGCRNGDRGEKSTAQATQKYHFKGGGILLIFQDIWCDAMCVGWGIRTQINKGKSPRYAGSCPHYGRVIPAFSLQDLQRFKWSR